MNIQRKLLLSLFIITTLIVSMTGIMAASSSDPSALGVVPGLITGNPDLCAGGYRVDPGASGTYALDAFGNTVVVNATDTANGPVFNWSVSPGIMVDHVIVKGGPDANDYNYTGFNPRPAGDGNLHSPVLENGKYAGLSHIDFCYHYQLTVSKDAYTSYTRTWHWDIDKSVTPDTWHMFTGDSGTSRYTVSVTRTGYTDSDWMAWGSIYINNNTPHTATITGVADSISGYGDVLVDCGVPFPYDLASGASLTCSYGTHLPDGSNRVNTATVSTSSPMVEGGGASADVIFGNPSTQVNASINVNDTNGASWSTSDSATWTYERTFSCDADEGSHPNTATIYETGQSDSASVSVYCYAPEVSKDAHTSFTRTWNWTIDKSADQSELTLSAGQVFLVNYTVDVDAWFVDSAWAVNGTLEVYNPAPVPAMLNGVNDLVSPAIAASVDCGVSFPYSLGAGQTLSCTYNASLPDASARTNTATATLQNYDYAYNGAATASGTSDFSGTAAVSFDAATMTEIDECVDVSDTNVGFLGTVCASSAPATFSYSYEVGAYETCGVYEHANVASFVTNDTSTSGSDDWTIIITVPCGGCTLTQGYWKTHSEFGHAPYDDTWAMLPDGASTLFYNSGLSWYAMFNTPPTGRVYVQLAHQYMAARLNQLNGADTTAINSTLASAEAWLMSRPAGIPDVKGKDARDVAGWASMLDSYNNGYIGPGHCDE